MAQCFRTVATKSINAPAVVFAKDYPCLTLGAAGLREHGAARDPDQSSPTFDGVVVCREIARRIAMQLQSTHYCLRPQIVGGGIGDHFGQSDAGESVVQCRSRSFGGISVSARLLRFAQPVQNPAARVIPPKTNACGISVLCLAQQHQLTYRLGPRQQRKIANVIPRSSSPGRCIIGLVLPMRVYQTPNSTKGSITTAGFTRKLEPSCQNLGEYMPVRWPSASACMSNIKPGSPKKPPGSTMSNEKYARVG